MDTIVDSTETNLLTDISNNNHTEFDAGNNSISTNPPELESLEKSETSIDSKITVVEKIIPHSESQDTVASVSELAETDNSVKNFEETSIGASVKSIPQSVILENNHKMSVPEEIVKAQFLVESANISSIEAFLSSGRFQCKYCKNNDLAHRNNFQNIFESKF